MDPTAEELLFARKWAAAQSPAVTVEEPRFESDGWFIANIPDWLECEHGWDTEERSWSAIAISLRQFRASLAGVIIEDCIAALETRKHQSMTMAESDELINCITTLKMIMPVKQ